MLSIFQGNQGFKLLQFSFATVHAAKSFLPDLSLFQMYFFIYSMFVKISLWAS